MKKSILILLELILFCFAYNSYAQDQACLCQIYGYTGPKNKEELKIILDTSKQKILVELDSMTKKSMVEYMFFADGIPTGMSGTDSNIQNIYNSDKAEVIFSIIFGMTVIIHTFETKPSMIDIPIDEFLTKFPSKEPIVNWVSNGIEPSIYTLNACCGIGGFGCMDKLIGIVNDTFYRLTNPLPIIFTVRNETIKLGQSIKIGGDSIEGNTYQWSPSIGLNSTNIANPIASPKQTTHYSLTVTNKHGCSSSKILTVTVNNPFLSYKWISIIVITVLTALAVAFLWRKNH